MKCVQFRPTDGHSIVVDEPTTGDLGHNEVAVEAVAASAGPFDLASAHDATTAHARTPGVGGIGVVRAVGEDVCDIRVGDHVVVDTVLRCGRCDACLASDADECWAPILAGVSLGVPGAMAEQICLPEANVHVVPATSGAEGVLLPYAAWAFRALRLSGFLAGDTVVVIGAGLLGAITAVVADVLGASTVTVVDDRLTARAAVADVARCAGVAAAGVAAFNDPDAPWRADGPDVVVCSTGDRASLRTSLAVAGARTSIILLHLQPGAAVDVDDYIPDLLSKEARIDAFASTSRDDFRRVTQLWVAGVLDLSRIPLHRCTIEELPAVARDMSNADELPYRYLDLAAAPLVGEGLAS